MSMWSGYFRKKKSIKAQPTRYILINNDENTREKGNAIYSGMAISRLMKTIDRIMGRMYFIVYYEIKRATNYFVI